MGAVGSTFNIGGGGLVIAIVYLILGPGGTVYNLSRLAFNEYSYRTRSRATLSPSDFDTIKSCLPWNIGISLLPVIPFILNGLHGSYH
jgi:hypothetical protein